MQHKFYKVQWTIFAYQEVGSLMSPHTNYNFLIWPWKAKMVPSPVC